MDNSFLFMAGIRVGMPDQFTYTLDGDLSIKAGGQDSGARLDFHAWLLKMADSGNGDFQGYLQYAGGNFDARLWGHLNLMGGIAQVDMGNSASNAAVDMHFGPSGPWHVDAGKQQGPRISGQLLYTTANMYVMLSDAGLSLGGGEGINLDVGDDSVASAYVRGDVDVGRDGDAAAAYLRRFFGECIRRSVCGQRVRERGRVGADPCRGAAGGDECERQHWVAVAAGIGFVLSAFVG